MVVVTVVERHTQAGTKSYT